MRAFGWLGTGLLLPLLTGCNLAEAAVDGMYGGISDTIAGAMSNTLLTLLGLNAG